MSTAESNTTLPRSISWAYAVIAAIVSAFVLFLVSEVLQRVTPHADAIGFVCYVLVVVAAVFLICRLHPASVWFAPVICNAAGILSACFEPTFWQTKLWIVIAAGWGLSVIAAAVAAKSSRTPFSEPKPEPAGTTESAAR